MAPAFGSWPVSECGMVTETGKRKKSVAMTVSSDGTQALAELHWYEVHGIGKVKMKVKRWL